MGETLDLWVSPTGRIYIAGEPGLMTVTLEAGSRTLAGVDSVVPSGVASVEHVWGLDDDCIFSWGGGVLGGRDLFMWHWNGSAWTRVESPGRIHAMHGVARDAIFAVGAEGLFARWDSARWHVLASPPDPGHVSFVHASSPDEVYACSIGGVLYEASTRGVRMRAESAGTAFGVVKWRDRVLVAGGYGGFLALDGPALKPFFEQTQPFLLPPCKDEVLYLVSNGLESTNDFVNFRYVFDMDLAAALGPRYRIAVT
jgi:hypothetical protein